MKNFEKRLLNFLLKDKTTRRNIIWATDDYTHLGADYATDKEITIKAIMGKNSNVIRPRVEKTKEEQNNRIRNKAEVFTPSWVCNKQNNLIDEAWFGRNNVFNTETEKGWKTITEKVAFPEGKNWKDYVKANRLEISCGEAPYLTSRYDTVSGEPIRIENRIGLLDRKLRVVCENCDSEPERPKLCKAFTVTIGREITSSLPEKICYAPLRNITTTNLASLHSPNI